MARPKSEDKHQAILAAAMNEFAARGVWSTPTSAISKAAGVAEGTLFTYFATKEILINEIYRELKRELAVVMLGNYPHDADPRSKFRHIWVQYVQWGVACPNKLKVMAQLRNADTITAASRAEGMAPFITLGELAQSCIDNKMIRDYPVAYIAAMLGSLAETTMEFVAKDEHGGAQFYAAGFDTLWQGIALPSPSGE
jgi:AcrR family transcriptional regulator